MKRSDKYLKIVRWSDEDQCYIGRCPELFIGGCHGDNQVEVYEELCEIVEWHIENELKMGKNLPKPKEYSGKFNLRINPSLHKVLSIEADKSSKSLNEYINDIIRERASA